MSPARFFRPFLPALLAVLAAVPAAAQLTEGELILVDQDADPTGNGVFGSLFRVDPTAAADTNATFLFNDPLFYLLQEIVIGTPDEIYILDSGADPSGLGPDPNDPSYPTPQPGIPYNSWGAIFLLQPSTGTLTLVADGSRYSGAIPGGRASIFVSPQSMTMDREGNLIVADADSDPSGFGVDLLGFAGRGAILRVDPRTGSVGLISDGSNYTSGAIPDFDGDTVAEPTIFQDPWSVRVDPQTGDLLVLDSVSDPRMISGASIQGALFRVDPVSGAVELESETADFLFPFEVGLGGSGTIYLADRDASIGASTKPGVLFQIDPAGNPATNATIFSENQYDNLVSAAPNVAPSADPVWSVDTDADPLSRGYSGAVFRIDPLLPRGANAVAASSTADFENPYHVQPVPTQFPTVTSVSPSGCGPGSTLFVTITGTGFEPGAGVRFGAGLTVTGVTRISATEIRATLTIPPGTPPGMVDVRAVNPGSAGSYDAPIFEVTGGGGPPPPLPLGDINLDRTVDGLDLSILGFSFGGSECDPAGPPFNDAADLNNDSSVDGADLAILSSRFGLRY